jgi:hypothetical protein
MTNFERKKKNGALDALRGHRTGRLAGILADIGNYPGGCSLSARRRVGARSERCRQRTEAYSDSSVSPSHGRTSKGLPLSPVRCRRRARPTRPNRRTSSFSWRAILSSSLRSRLLIGAVATVPETVTVPLAQPATFTQDKSRTDQSSIYAVRADGTQVLADAANPLTARTAS